MGNRVIIFPILLKICGSTSCLRKCGQATQKRYEKSQQEKKIKLDLTISVLIIMDKTRNLTTLNFGGINIKYFRFHGNYISPYTKQPYGIFVVIYHLLRDGRLTEEDATLYTETNDWFEENLPNPPFYDDQNTIRAVTWFKNNENAKEMLEQLNPFFYLAEKYAVEIIKSESDELPGELVYEDDYQIGIINKII